MENDTKNAKGEENTPEMSEADGRGGYEEKEAMEPLSSDPEARISALEEQLKATHGRWLRAAADLDNFRKRTKRDLEDAAARGRAEVLLEVLPVLDSIDLALASADPQGPESGIFEGIVMIQKQFLSAAERFNLRAVESLGVAFDPNYHEAVAQVVSADQPAGRIVEEMRKGYRLGERLLRPAMVVVAMGPAAAKEAPASPPYAGADEAGGEESE